MRFALIAAALLAAAATAPRAAYAQACCMSAAAVGVGRLAEWEDAAGGLRLAAAGQVGLWTANGRFVSLNRNTRNADVTAEVWALGRIAAAAQIYVAAPFVYNVRSSPGVRDRGGGLGDVRLGARWDIIPVGDSDRYPSVALIGGFVWPSGRPAERADGPAAADATGRGRFVPSVGVQVEYGRERWFVRLDAALAQPLPRSLPGQPGAREVAGPQVSAALSVGAEVHPGVVLTGVLRGRFEAAPVFRGLGVAGAPNADAYASVNLTYTVTRAVALQVSLETPLAFAQAGADRAALVTGSVGVRIAAF